MSITPEKIETLTPHINNLLNELRGLESDDPSNAYGENLAYVVQELIHRSYSIRPRDAIEAMGVLEYCKQATYAHFNAYHAT